MQTRAQVDTPGEWTRGNDENSHGDGDAVEHFYACSHTQKSFSFFLFLSLPLSFYLSHSLAKMGRERDTKGREGKLALCDKEEYGISHTTSARKH